MIAIHACIGQVIDRDDKGKATAVRSVRTVYPDERYCPYCKQPIVAIALVPK